LSLFSFKQETNLYIVYSGIQYLFDISEINFSQTIAEDSYSEKTLQVQNLFEQSKIYKANPANFEFKFPAIREDDLKVIFNRLLDCYTFDIYVETGQDLFKITNCILTKGLFKADRFKPLALIVNGEGSQLSRVGDAGVGIPGTPEARSGDRTYNRVKDVSVLIDTAPEITNLTSVETEITNKITWRKNVIIEGCESGQTIKYPIDFTVDKKEVSGNFFSNIVSDTTFLRDSTLQIQIGEIVGSTFYGFDFNIPNAVITSRPVTGQIFKHAYNWRLISNPASLYEVINYETYAPGAAGAILDNFNNPVLDFIDDAILEST
jgi:hypothetical protein